MGYSLFGLNLQSDEDLATHSHIVNVLRSLVFRQTHEAPASNSVFLVNSNSQHPSPPACRLRQAAGLSRAPLSLTRPKSTAHGRPRLQLDRAVALPSSGPPSASNHRPPGSIPGGRFPGVPAAPHHLLALPNWRWVPSSTQSRPWGATSTELGGNIHYTVFKGGPPCF